MNRVAVTAVALSCATASWFLAPGMAISPDRDTSPIERPGPRSATTKIAWHARASISSATITPKQDDTRLPRFADVSAASGIDFAHHHGGVGDKHLPETMGSGVGWLDYDLDGKWDLYFVDSGPLPDAGQPENRTAREGQDDQDRQPPVSLPVSPPVDPVADRQALPTPPGRNGGVNGLYRNAADGTFELAAAAGAGDAGYGMGVTVADFDADGWPDLFVANFGANALYRNNGDGTFANITSALDLDKRSWSVSAAWGELDADGFPELYVTNYVAYDVDNPIYCGDLERELRSYCHIQLFDGVADVLYDNRGGLDLIDVSEAAGVANASEGKGLGVVMGDVDNDGDADIYVANDTTRNFLYMNRGGLEFEDIGLIAGVGYSVDGKPQAGMGTDLGDVDGDGGLDIVVTNFAFESMSLYRALAPESYLDDTFALGLGEPSLAPLGFGVALVDLDGDLDLDVVVANGHILDEVSEFKDNTTYAQPNQVFTNRLAEMRQAAGEAAGNLFRDTSAEAGPAITRARVSRGLAVGDHDGDGWPDVAINNSNGPAELLENVTGSTANRLVVRLRGRRANRDALGARVRVLTATGDNVRGEQLFEVKSASSYGSQSATDLYAGLGTAPEAALEIRWPDGTAELAEGVEAGQLVLVVQGRGVVGRQPLSEH